MKPNVSYKISNNEYICEFGRSAERSYIKIWNNKFPELDVTHILNIPDYGHDAFCLDISTADGFTKREMIGKAAIYGFTQRDFDNGIRSKTKSAG